MLFVVTSSLINSKIPYNKCSFHYLDHSFTLDSQHRKKSEEAITLIIRIRNAAIRVMYLMSSIYFAPGTARESKVCGNFCLNTMHRIFPCGQRVTCNEQQSATLQGFDVFPSILLPAKNSMFFVPTWHQNMWLIFHSVAQPTYNV
jgi:hypothetical protein